MNKFTFVPVPIPLIGPMWSKLSPHVLRVVDVAPDEVTLFSVKERAMKGETTLVTVLLEDEVVAVLTVEIRTFDSGNKALYLPIIGGDYLDEWMDDIMEGFKDIAKQKGCFQIRGIAARTGWKRKLKSRGWHVVHEVLALDIGA